MSDDTSLEDALRNVGPDQFLKALWHMAEKLQGEGDTSLFTHPGLKGEQREKAVINLIRPMLPMRYGLAPGQVFDHTGEVSRQQDVIIFDDLHSTVFRAGTDALCAAESVYGSIEVKSQLDGAGLDAAVETIASLKRLDREDSDMLDFEPTVRLNLGAGLDYSKRKLNHYIGWVVGMRGIGHSSLASQLNALVQEYGPTWRCEAPLHRRPWL